MGRAKAAITSGAPPASAAATPSTTPQVLASKLPVKNLVVDLYFMSLLYGGRPKKQVLWYKSAMEPTAKSISAARAALGLTTTEFGKCIGVTNSYISALEAGRRTPSRRLLVKINRLMAHRRGPDRTIRAIVTTARRVGPWDAAMGLSSSQKKNAGRAGAGPAAFDCD